MAQHQYVLEFRAPQVQIPVAQAQVFACSVPFFLVGRYGKGDRFGAVQYDQVPDPHLDPAGRKFRVNGFLRSLADRAPDRNHILVAHQIGAFVGFFFVLGGTHDLCQSGNDPVDPGRLPRQDRGEYPPIP